MRTAWQHGDELAFGVEIGEQSAEVALVRAVPVHQQEHPLGRAPVHDTRHQGHLVSSTRVLTRDHLGVTVQNM